MRGSDFRAAHHNGGDTTAFYLDKRLRDTGVKITTLARGVAVGDELQYADELTLIRSLQQRLPYASSGGTSPG